LSLFSIFPSFLLISYSIFEDVKGRKLSYGTIQQKYGVGDDVEKIDAAFIWNGNGRSYLFAGDNYYRFDDSRQSMDYGYPKPIVGNWEGLTGQIDGVSIWRNKITYFFRGKYLYISQWLLKLQAIVSLSRLII